VRARHGPPSRDDLKGSTLRSIFGIELSSAAQFVIAGVVIFILLALFALVLRRFAGGRLRVRGQGAGRARQPRLGVVDIYDLDQQRQLVLLRRDNVEHLIMIGGPNDVVVEASIVRGARAGTAQPGNASADDRPPAPLPGEVEAALPPIQQPLPPAPQPPMPSAPPVMPAAAMMAALPPAPPMAPPPVAAGALLAPAIIPDIGVPPAPRGMRPGRPEADFPAAPLAMPAPPAVRPAPAEAAPLDADLTRQIEEALQRSIVAPDNRPASGLVEPEGDPIPQLRRAEDARAPERREPAMAAPVARQPAPQPPPQPPRSLATPVAPAILPPRAPAMPRVDQPLPKAELPVAPALPRIDLSLRPINPVATPAVPSSPEPVTSQAPRPVQLEAAPAPDLPIAVEPVKSAQQQEPAPGIGLQVRPAGTTQAAPAQSAPAQSAPAQVSPVFKVERAAPAPVEPRKADVPAVELPKAEFPTLELPKVEFPKVDLPGADAPKPEPARAHPAKPEPRTAEPPADTGTDPFSVEAIEAEFARLLGRTVPAKDGPSN
jgi:hypothetical protein